MGNLFTYTKFLEEKLDQNDEMTRSKELDLLSFIDLFKEHCTLYEFNNSNHFIFRGSKHTEPYLYVDPKKYNRASMGVGVHNYYTLIVDSSNIWSAYSKRSQSVIGINSKKIAEVYGNLYYIIPYDKTIFSVSPKNDFIFSFSYLNERKFDAIDFNEILKNFYQDIFKEKFNDENYKNFMKCMKRFDNVQDRKIIEKRMPKLKMFFMKELWNKFTHFNKKNLDFIDFLSFTVFNPKQNNFRLLAWENKLKIPKNKELWTDSECLLVRYDYINEVINKMKK